MERSVSRLREVGCTVFLPSELLRPDGARRPAVGRISHPVIHDPILGSIRALDETRMPYAICTLGWVLVEDRIFVLEPIRRIHGVAIGGKLK